MPQFAANLSMLFTEYPFLERFDRAAAAGFAGVEFLFPYDEDVSAIREALTRNSLQQVLFNLPAGDFAGGERGIANDPGREGDFREGVTRALEIAAILDCPRLNCLAGLTLADVPTERQRETLVANLRYAAEAAAAAGIQQLLEPLNTVDTPGFFVPTAAEALAIIISVGHPNLTLQLDVYHAVQMGEDPLALIDGERARIGHVQIADSPGRHQPGTGDIDFRTIFARLDAAGYDGWVSLEYRPDGPTEASLAWLRAMGYRA